MTVTDETGSVPGTRPRPGRGAAGLDGSRIPGQRRKKARRPNSATDDVARLRELARRGELRTAGDRKRLYRAAYSMAHQIVFDVVTRRVELNRGHVRCARGVLRLEGACLDGFHDDVESVVEHLLAATKPIDDLEGWLAHWAPRATVDGYRRRRGARGALQRPRMTRQLADGLRDDPWLCELALKMLIWVGAPTGAGAGIWPLESWAQSRAVRTGDHLASTPARVAAEVEQVLDVMRRRPEWYLAHVERPLGYKIAPVAAPPGDGPADPRPLLPATPDEVDEARIAGVAWAAMEAIRAGLAKRKDATETVVGVLTTLFLEGTGADEIDRVPGSGPGREEHVSALLGDPAARLGIVDRILRVVLDCPG